MIAKKKVNLNKLIAQNKNVLKEHCSSEYFRNVKTFEEEFIEICQTDEFQKCLKTMCCAEIDLASNGYGEIQLKFVFSNDECASKKVKGFKQKLESLSFLKELAEKLERDAKKGE